MKNFLPFIILTLLLNSCSNPGSLGSSATAELDCSEDYVKHVIDDVAQLEPFQVSAKDSTIVNWWQENGYDFLNYKCVLLKKRLYMVTIQPEGGTESSVSIRSYYNRKKKTWVLAQEFTATDEYRAEKAMELLVKEFSSCEKE